MVAEFAAGGHRMSRRIDLNNQANRSILAVLFLFRRARRESDSKMPAAKTLRSPERGDAAVASRKLIFFYIFMVSSVSRVENGATRRVVSVSYTHLTLPTIYSV